MVPGLTWAGGLAASLATILAELLTGKRRMRRTRELPPPEVRERRSSGQVMLTGLE